MLNKCSLPAGTSSGAFLPVLALLLVLNGCSGSGAATETASAPEAADTSAAGGAEPPAPSQVPVTIQRPGSTRTPDQTPASAARPPYAALQPVPLLSESFVSQYNVEAPADWAASAAEGLVALNGCSAALISDAGLAITSASCLRTSFNDALLTASSGDSHHLAASSGEQRIPGAQVWVLETATDVSALVDSLQRTNPELTNDEVRVQALATAGPTAGSDVFFQDTTGRAAVYSFRRIEDVRLVFMPEHELVTFGGEHDAGSFPQFRLDVALIRLYRGGAPAPTPRHYRWNSAPLRSGGIIYAIGTASAFDEVAVIEGARIPVLSAGSVRGFRYEATVTAPLSVFHGLYDRHHSFGRRGVWSLPEVWVSPPPGLDLDTPLALASTTEFAPGMLGGAILGRDLSYRATIFDTNDQAVLGQVTGRRIVALQSAALKAALETVYGAGALLQEMESGNQGAP